MGGTVVNCLRSIVLSLGSVVLCLGSVVNHLGSAVNHLGSAVNHPDIDVNRSCIDLKISALLVWQKWELIQNKSLVLNIDINIKGKNVVFFVRKCFMNHVFCYF